MNPDAVPRELVILSGKGGTGKTSIAASLAMLAHQPVVADCDVDAADLHLLLSPVVARVHPFLSGHSARIRSRDCQACGLCHRHCRFAAVRPPSTPANGAFTIDDGICEGCGVCVQVCPAKAIDFTERACGEWYESRGRSGPMFHARLTPAAENSGKLVSTVRREARRYATEGKHSLVLVDGPPGIGCPVIASLGGADLVLVVTEPTVAGEHDLSRVLQLARHFSIPALVCINKWDINPIQSERIEAGAVHAGAVPVGRIRYDRAVTRAQLAARTVVEEAGAASADIRAMWPVIQKHLYSS